MRKLNVKPRSIFCHDNLEVLQGMNSECIDLIYLDPPFNKKKQFSAPIGSAAEGAEFSDLFREEDVKDEWVRTIESDNYQLYSLLTGVKEFSNKYNYCYLVYMAIRVLEMHRILKSSGSIYLHCDPTMSHYLKLMLDCIFGENHFKNEIVWGYEKPRSAKNIWRRNHDTLIFYSKTNNWKFNVQRVPKLDGTFELRKPFKRPDGSVWAAKEPGKQAGSWWYDIPSFATRMSAKERTGYPTQKPLALLERIIAASSNKGDMVLDPFCGCATTCIAAEKLERQWIGIDVSHKAYELVKLRLENEVSTDLFRGEPNYTTKPPVRDEDVDVNAGYIYIMKNKILPGLHKVGISSDPESRARSVLSSAPADTKVLWKHKTALNREIESYIHNKFPREKEWVEASLDEIKEEIMKYERARK